MGSQDVASHPDMVWLPKKDRAVVPEKLEEGGLAAVDREDGEQKRGLLQRGLSTREASRECWLSVPLWSGGMT